MIVIKNMNMPHDCAECFLNYDERFCRYTGISFWCDIPEGFKYEQMRLPECPLVEVPDPVIGGRRKWEDDWQ